MSDETTTDDSTATFARLADLLVEVAAGLLEPGEFDVSPEYVRGMVELIVRSMEATGDQEPESHVRVAEIMERLRERTDVGVEGDPGC